MPSDALPTDLLLDSLHQITIKIAREEALAHVLQDVADLACRVSGARCVAMRVVGTQLAADTLVISRAEPEAQGGGTEGRCREILSVLADQPQVVHVPGGPSSLPVDRLLRPLTGGASLLSVPLLVGTDCLGQLCLLDKAAADLFTPFDVKAAKLLAAQAALAVKKLRLVKSHVRRSKELEARTRQLAALNNASMAIAGELVLDKVLQQIVNSARELVGAEYAALGVPSREGTLESFVYSGINREDAARIPRLPQGQGLLGAIIRERRPIRIANIEEDPRSVGFPPNHPDMHSFVGIPVVAGGETLGNLYLTNKRDGLEFTATDQELLEMLAAHAAIVIQNSRLYEQVGRLAIVAERARIGMDLHDGVIQSIYAVGLTLESVRLALPEEDSEIDQLLGHAIEGLNETIRDIRNFILDLRPRRFSGDLDQGMARLVREFQANTMIPVTLKVTPEDVTALPTPVARAVFLTTQEALANIARHARASRVMIEAYRDRGSVKLMIEDDGRGFDMEAQVQTVGHGLSNMRARAEELHGSFSLNSASGQGTKIVLTLPMPE
ncbi:MAG: GAF domain-containing protein [Anaerolineae bacterium]